MPESINNYSSLNWKKFSPGIFLRLLFCRFVIIKVNYANLWVRKYFNHQIFVSVCSCRGNWFVNGKDSIYQPNFNWNVSERAVEETKVDLKEKFRLRWMSEKGIDAWEAESRQCRNKLKCSCCYDLVENEFMQFLFTFSLRRLVKWHEL